MFYCRVTVCARRGPRYSESSSLGGPSADGDASPSPRRLSSMGRLIRPDPNVGGFEIPRVFTSSWRYLFPRVFFSLSPALLICRKEVTLMTMIHGISVAKMMMMSLLPVINQLQMMLMKRQLRGEGQMLVAV